MMHEPLVIIEWRDIVSSSSWTSRNDVLEKEPAVCRSTGYLLVSNAEKVTIYHACTGDDELDYEVFPAGAVVRIVPIQSKGTDSEST